MDFKLQRAKNLFRSRQLAAMFLAGANNILYFTDVPITNSAANPVLNVLQKFTPSVLCITAEGERILFSSAALSQYFDENLTGVQVRYYPTSLFIDYWHNVPQPDIYAEDLGACLKKYLAENKLIKGKIGVDKEFKAALGISSLGGLPELAMENVDDDLSVLRSIKSAEEIRRMRIASQAAYAAMDKVRELVESGQAVTENSLFLTVRNELLMRGCQWNFTTVACGAFSADIYHQPLEYRLQAGDAVRMDIGAVYQGYGTDVARTFFAPAPAEELRRLYTVLTEAQKKVLESLKPGVKLRDLFHLGQEHVRRHGYPQYKRTMIGHSVGLDTEEDPFISPGSDVVLAAGMVMAVELPYYIKSLAGLNIEDIVLITEGGFEFLR